MPTDLNNWTVPLQIGGVREVMDATNMWPGAPVNPASIYVDINKIPGAIYQTGYDPVTGRNWIRYKPDGAAWSSWRSFDGSLTPDPPLPTYAQSINGSTLVEIFFTVSLDPTSTPLVSAFTVTGKTVSAVQVAPPGRPNTVRLTINSSLPGAGGATVAYTKPAPPTLKSIDAVDVANFSNVAITMV